MSTYDDHILALAVPPLAFYPTTDLVDAVGALDGTLYNSPTTAAGGTSTGDNALVFDGINQYATVPDWGSLVDTGEQTIEFIAKVLNAEIDGGGWVRKAPSSYEWDLYQYVSTGSTVTLYGHLWASAGAVVAEGESAAFDPTTFAMYHLVVASTGSVFEAYRNNALIFSDATWSGTPGAGTAVVTLAQRVSGTYNNIAIEKVAYYGYALDSTEREANYQAMLGVFGGAVDPMGMSGFFGV